MQSYTTTTTWTSTGIKTVTPGFQAKVIRISILPATGSPFQGVQFCYGRTDLTRKSADSVYANLSNGLAESEKSTSKLFRLRGEPTSGALGTILEGILDSVTATQVKFNVQTADATAVDFQVTVECDG